MERININATNIDTYYEKINAEMDAYFNIHISPKQLSMYFDNKDNLSNFKKKCGLESVVNIDKVIKDILHDRLSVVTESIYTYDVFNKMTKNDIFKGLDRANTSIQNVLADYFELPLSKIEYVDMDKNIYNINGDKYFCFDAKNNNTVANNIIDYIVDDITKQDFELSFLDVNIQMSKFIDVKLFRESLIKSIGIEQLTKFFSLYNKCEYITTIKDSYFVWYIAD